MTLENVLDVLAEKLVSFLIEQTPESTFCNKMRCASHFGKYMLSEPFQPYTDELCTQCCTAISCRVLTHTHKYAGWIEYSNGSDHYYWNPTCGEVVCPKCFDLCSRRGGPGWA